MKIEKDKITLRWYAIGFLKGLLYWIPFTLVVLIIPIVGWILLPIVPIFPFVYPFLDREARYKKMVKESKK